MNISNTKRLFLSLMLVAATATSAGCAFFPFGHGPHGGGAGHSGHGGDASGNHGGNSGHGGGHDGGNGQHQEPRP